MKILGFILLISFMNMNLITPAHGHARLASTGAIVPRSQSAGLKTAPCGGVARTNAPKILQAGSTITVNWQETINHPGRFEFYFSAAGDQNFQLLKTVPDTQNDGNTPHNYTTTIQLPNVTCTACTIQMIQVMTEDPNNPENYYSCADIQLVRGTGGSGGTNDCPN